MKKRYEIINSGMCNSIIAGYLIAALEEAGFPPSEVKNACQCLVWAFDVINAEEAEALYEKRPY